MPIFTGKTADGSDMKEFKGVFVNPDNPNEWSSNPYPSQTKELEDSNNYDDHAYLEYYPLSKKGKMYHALHEYMNGRYTINDVYLQIKEKKCKLSASLRNYVLSLYEN